MNDNEKAREVMLGAVFMVFCNAECGSYMTMYAPEKVVVSTKEIAKILKWTEYRTRKAIKALVERGWIERASIGCPAVVSYGDYTELVCEAMPPKNGFAITQAGFQTDLWNGAYADWCKSMEEWANSGTHDLSLIHI